MPRLTNKKVRVKKAKAAKRVAKKGNGARIIAGLKDAVKHAKGAR